MEELLLIIFGALFVATLVLAPWCAAENRPEFLRPDLKQRHRWDGPIKLPNARR